MCPSPGFNCPGLGHTGTYWQIELVASQGAAGWKSSLALDSNEQPHISYHDIGNGTLQYARGMLNRPPSANAGGPYSGDEGSPIALDASAEDFDEDPLTYSWSHTIDSADSGVTCSFGNANQLSTSFSCTDDGTFTITLETSDGVNPAVTGSATVTVANADPSITDVTAIVSGPQATVTVEASDPATNDVLSYAFDCDDDGDYEVDSGTTNTGICSLATSDGTYTIGVQVSDDDGGVATAAVTVAAPTLLCASKYTGMLRYTADCQDHETSIIIPGAEPVEVCASSYTGLLRMPGSRGCEDHETTYVLPEDGPLNVCVNGYTLTMRVVGDLGQCASHEFGRALAPTDAGETSPPGSR